MSNFLTALVQLPLVRETAREKIRTPDDVYRVCGDIAQLAQESFFVLTVTAKHHLISRHLVSLGLVDASLVHPREVFRVAIREDGGASALVLAHNHPTGDPTPSAEDIRITRQLVQAGQIVDITVLDHVVIGRPLGSSPAFVSMRESGLCTFA